VQWAAIFEPPELSDLAVAALLLALLATDVDWLERHPETPELYRSGVRYAVERIERWKSIPAILRDGSEDCEGLACWRAAELRVRSHIDARPVFSKHELGSGRQLYHIRVQYPDGSLEDPSERLGMKG
jgi:hypothetical protein